MNANETPAETIIYYSKPKSLVLMVIGALVLAVGPYFIIGPKQVLAGAILCVLGAVFFLIGLSKYLNNDPQLVISDAGIQSKKMPLIGWNEISNEIVKRRLVGKVIVTYIVFDLQGQKQKIKISGYNVNKAEMEDLLKFYRNRFEQHNKQLI